MCLKSKPFALGLHQPRVDFFFFFLVVVRKMPPAASVWRAVQGGTIRTGLWDAAPAIWAQV